MLPIREVITSRTSMPRIRSTSISLELMRVVLAAAVPVWLASAVLLYKVRVDRRALIQRDAGATVRALMVAVDRDLASAQATASALVVSPYLRSGELARFYEQSKATLNPKIATNIVLSDASGRQLLDTLRPYGAALPAARESGPAAAGVCQWPACDFRPVYRGCQAPASRQHRCSSDAGWQGRLRPFDRFLPGAADRHTASGGIAGALGRVDFR